MVALVNCKQRWLLILLFAFNIFCFASSTGKLLSLNEENWEQILKGEWMVEFYAPWCPACKNLAPVWKEFASWSDDLDIKVGDVDVVANPGMSGRFMITALPTIFHVKDGVFRQYRGSRDKDSLIRFVEDKNWQSLEPVPSWQAPHSLQMSVVSVFFKFSMVIRNIHSQLVEGYGLPAWVSYLIFAAVTVLVGSLLGLLLVVIIDLIYPAKPHPLVPPPPPPPPSVVETTAKEASEEEPTGPETRDDTKEEESEEKQELRKRIVPQDSLDTES